MKELDRPKLQELPPDTGPFAVLQGPEMPTQGNFTHGFPEGLIVHFTAGRYLQGVQNAIDTAKYGAKHGLAYWVLARDGTTLKTHPVTRWGYHAGVSSHPLLGSSVSSRTIGVELCNGGKLLKKNGEFKTWYGSTVDAKYVRQIKKPRYQGEEPGYYHMASPAQESALLELILGLKKLRPDIFQLEKVLGHDEVAGGRKNDPGGALSIGMEDFRKILKAQALKRGIPNA